MAFIFIKRILFIVYVFRLIAYSEELPFKLFTVADGLGSPFVNSIMCDSSGFLWFSTLDGLSCFDGNRFETYTTDHGLPSSSVESMLRTRDGTYLVIIGNRKVSQFFPEGVPQGSAQNVLKKSAPGERILFQDFPIGNDSLTYPIRVLYEDRSGTLWGGGRGRIVWKEKNKSTFSSMVYPSPIPQDALTASTVIEDKEGNIWLDTFEGIIRYSRDGRLLYFPLPPLTITDFTTDLLFDREGRLWVALRNSGIYVIVPPGFSETGGLRKCSTKAEMYKLTIVHPSQYSSKMSHLQGYAYNIDSTNGLPDNWVMDLHQAQDSTIWIATGASLTHWDREKFHHFTVDEGLSNNPIRCVTQDHRGNLWVGTANGAIKFDLTGFSKFDVTDGLNHLRVHSFQEDKNGSLFVVSGYSVINKFDGSRFTPIKPNVPPNVSYGWASQVAFLDRSERWWILSDSGLYRFPKQDMTEWSKHNKPEAVFLKKNGLTGNRMFRMFEDSSGDFWISTKEVNPQESGLTKFFKKTGTVKRYTTAEGFPAGKSISAFCEDSHGSIWMGFYEGGLVRYRNEHFSTIETPDTLFNSWITGLLLDKNRSLWVTTTSKGAIRIDSIDTRNFQFTKYYRENGLSNSLRCMTQDRFGRLYFGTMHGIDRLTPENGLVRHYNSADGLSGEYVTVAFRDSQDNLWFGTYFGLSRLTPEPNHVHPPPMIRIGNVQIAGMPLPISKLGEKQVVNLECEANENTIEIEYFSTSFSIGKEQKYQYMLTGVDNKWNTIVNVRSMHFAHLPPGKYQFLVRAINSDGIVSKDPASVSFVILSHIWQRWWFLTIASLGLVIIGFGMYHRRISSLKKERQLQQEFSQQLINSQENERKRIAHELHDGIGQNLLVIKNRATLALQSSPQDDPTTNQLEAISSISSQTINDVREISYNLRPHQLERSGLTKTIQSTINRLADASKVRFSIELAPIDNLFSKEAEINIFRIIQEGMNNIIKHSEANEAKVHIEKTAIYVIITIQDNGKGFNMNEVTSEKTIETGFGLRGISERTKILNSTLSVTSIPNQGTTLKILIPLEGHYGKPN